jgi:kinesin family protein 18/19
LSFLKQQTSSFFILQSSLTSMAFNYNKTQRAEKILTKNLCPVQELPSQISSEEERELLALMCRVHELEVEKMALQSERFIKQHELWRRDLVIFRYDRQRHLCEEIITRQRQLMEGNLTI